MKAMKTFLQFVDAARTPCAPHSLHPSLRGQRWQSGSTSTIHDHIDNVTTTGSETLMLDVALSLLPHDLDVVMAKAATAQHSREVLK